MGSSSAPSLSFAPGVRRGALPLQRDRRQGSAARLPCRSSDSRVWRGGGARGGSAAGARAVDRALADAARPHLCVKVRGKEGGMEGGGVLMFSMPQLFDQLEGEREGCTYVLHA